MPLFDIFKKKKKELEEEKVAKEEKKEKLEPQKELEVKTGKKEKTGKEKTGKEKTETRKEQKKEQKKEKVIRKRKKTSNPYRFLESAHITEKATDLSRLNQYLFRVPSQANKIEIKKSVEDIYDVNVLKVRIVNIPERERRLGRTKGIKRGYKKAIVKIKEGQKIELLPQ
jgi:large subunit ribosomal protein L23